MKSRTLFCALATLMFALVFGATTARAQLPPSPTDGQPSSPDAVRPTAPPRAAPPPPPARRPPRVRPRAPVATVPGAPPPAPPPPPAVVPPPPGPTVVKASQKRYGTRGVFELGGSFDFSVQRDLENEATWLNLGLDVYVGYFVVKYLTLGLYLSVNFAQNQAAGTKSWSVIPGFLLAPGVAVNLARRVFFYGDLLGGLFGRRAVLEGFAASRDKELYGAVGGETGIKVRLTSRLLLRLGVRVLYNVGKRSSEQNTGTIDSKIGLINTTFRVGLTGYL